MTVLEARLLALARLAGLPIEGVTSINELLENAAVIFGPPVAGLALVAFGVERTLFITAACSLVAAAINGVSLPRHRRKIQAADGTDPVLAGARFLIRDRLLRTILWLAMAATPIAVLAAGFGVEAVGVGARLTAVSMTMALLTMIAFFNPALRGLRQVISKEAERFPARQTTLRPAAAAPPSSSTHASCWTHRP